VRLLGGFGGSACLSGTAGGTYTAAWGTAGAGAQVSLSKGPSIAGSCFLRWKQGRQAGGNSQHKWPPVCCYILTGWYINAPWYTTGGVHTRQHVFEAASAGHGEHNKMLPVKFFSLLIHVCWPRCSAFSVDLGVSGGG
jgi:hypothetical protein